MTVPSQPDEPAREDGHKDGQLEVRARERLYKRHLQGAVVRCGATLFIWLFVLLSFLMRSIDGTSFVGASLTGLAVILLNGPSLFVLKRTTRRRSYEIVSLTLNALEVLAYTLIIYFLGGIRATYLLVIYAAVIAYVGVAAPRRYPFVIAGLCALFFGSMVTLEHVGLLPHQAGISSYDYRSVDVALVLMIFTATLLVLAFISAYTSAALKAGRDELRRQIEAQQSVNQTLDSEMKQRRLAEAELLESERQLFRAKKMEAVGTLAGGVAHDLNNILGGLVGYPEMLSAEIPPDSPLRKRLLRIQKSGEKAAALAQDLLTLARRGLAVTEVVNLREVVSEYLRSPEYERLRRFHPKVELETRLENPTSNVLGSSVHLSKTVMNLVSNAAEAMPDGGKILVSLETRHFHRQLAGYEELDEGDYVTLQVADQGVGIAAADMDRIFEPFFTKKVLGRSGTGLGLAVVWGTVKDHQGYIDLQSSEATGSTFTLYFPASGQRRQRQVPTPVEEYMGSGESILVVDDVEEQRELAAGILTGLGYSATTVASGEAAVAHVKQRPPDLLVLDMIMEPGIDGLETYRRILQVSPGQKAIIASGFSETRRVEEAQRLGAGAYVSKPYLREAIGKAVRAELDRKR
jgi:signal transduction histidine kinase/ActR/RegA family two-component response regulator